ncbi:hypothetical protein BV898_14433 [Hypsibius exemplaris]|uniref:Uncharacterized protein n=1 Tax=Hypsibius exemplaris TaxID=2072580 RepID=A0A9X6RJH4_HYPEX|nr:hypothetical protein BV898_14433 [Hypsibius exemplaris]
MKNDLIAVTLTVMCLLHQDSAQITYPSQTVGQIPVTYPIQGQTLQQQPNLQQITTVNGQTQALPGGATPQQPPGAAIQPGTSQLSVQQQQQVAAPNFGTGIAPSQLQQNSNPCQQQQPNGFTSFSSFGTGNGFFDPSAVGTGRAAGASNLFIPGQQAGTFNGGLGQQTGGAIPGQSLLQQQGALISGGQQQIQTGPQLGQQPVQLNGQQQIQTVPQLGQQPVQLNGQQQIQTGPQLGQQPVQLNGQQPLSGIPTQTAAGISAPQVFGR